MNDTLHSINLPEWQDDITSRLQSAYTGIMLIAQNTPLPVWALVVVLLLLWIRYRPTEDEPSDLYLPMSTADTKIQFTHPFRPSPLPPRPSQLALGSSKFASMCELISPRTVLNNGLGSRSPSPTRSGSSSASSSASSSPLGSPRYPCRDPRCCGPLPPSRAGSYLNVGGGRSDNGSRSLRYPSGSGGGGGRADQQQTRRGTGRKGSWRCGLHAVLEKDEECAVGA